MKRGVPSILPLKHFERNFYVDPLQKHFRRREWLNISYGLVYIVLVIIGVSGLFLLDWLYYTGLDVVRQNALVNFTQSGSFNFTLTVNGTGLLARLVRNATNGLNFTEFQSMNETNAECLPQPTLTAWRDYFTVYALAALILYMNVNLMYSQRMMSVICGQYFPRRRRVRIKYLYNQMLIRRRIYFEENLRVLLADDHAMQAHNRESQPRKGEDVDDDYDGQEERGVSQRNENVRRKFKTLFKRFGDAWQRMFQNCGIKVKSPTTYCTVCKERGECE